MDDELSYVLLTPSTLSKARTGGVLTRLLTRTALDLCGAMMFGPSAELARACAENLASDSLAGDRDTKSAQLIRDYVLRQCSPADSGLRRRLMVLLFRGKNAIELIKSAVGDYHSPSIRNTYGEFVTDEYGQAVFFEPAVFCPSNAEAAAGMLRTLCRHTADGGLLEKVNEESGAASCERSLVMIKPDNFEYPCGRPGTIINIFSQTNLKIIACKIHRMTIAEAQEFYGPVLPHIVEAMGETAGRERFNNLVKFMTGHDPREAAELRHVPGSAKVMVLVYEGIGAIGKIRKVLGPTDPEKAPPGTIRREFGASMMVNTAHASDSPENALREMGILKIRENTFSALAARYYPSVA
jgi:nucleoside diphosphate kinase